MSLIQNKSTIPYAIEIFARIHDAILQNRIKNQPDIKPDSI